MAQRFPAVALLQRKTGEDEQLAWGIGLGGKYQITPETLLKADYYHVKGMDASYYGVTADMQLMKIIICTVMSSM